jgi:hypothetical protein
MSFYYLYVLGFLLFDLMENMRALSAASPSAPYNWIWLTRMLDRVAHELDADTAAQEVVIREADRRGRGGERRMRTMPSRGGRLWVQQGMVSASEMEERLWGEEAPDDAMEGEEDMATPSMEGRRRGQEQTGSYEGRE